MLRKIQITSTIDSVKLGKIIRSVVYGNSTAIGSYF